MLNPEEQRRRDRSRLLQKYLINPPAKLLVWVGWLRGHAILETVGRRTGQRRRVVVGVNRDDHGDYWMVAEQGRYAGYVRNIAAHPRVRLRVGGSWVDGTAEAMPDDDVEQRLATFPGAHVQAVKRFGTRLLSVRIVPS